MFNTSVGGEGGRRQYIYIYIYETVRLIVFPGFGAQSKKRTNAAPFRPQRAQDRQIRLVSWSDGCCLASWSAVCGPGWSSNLLAGSLANCWLESLSACRLAAVADMPANQLRGWHFSKLFVFRGLAVLDDSFAKMTYAGPNKKCEIFRGLDWLTSGWQLPGCPPGQRTGPPASWLLAG